MPYVNSLPNAEEVLRVAKKAHDGLEREFGEQSEVLVAKARRGFVAGALQETVVLLMLSAFFSSSETALTTAFP